MFKMNVFFVAVILGYTVFGIHAFISEDLEPLTDAIIKAINDLETTWKAGGNFNGHNFNEIKNLISNVTDNEAFETKTFNGKKLPENFDARLEWPNCTSIGKIYKQDSCTPSWIYASVGQIADRICIRTGVKIDVEKTIVNYFQLDPIEPKTYIDKMHALLDGPITIYLDVYSDFFSYKSGIYKRTSSKKMGTHAIKIIGWGVENGVKYWLISNSWGTQWGDKGFFKIRRGEGEFGVDIRSVAVSISSGKMPSSYDRYQLFYQ
uniref:Peptidase C1A papain C-terminal domain-containing protein n=1 Tax=Tetranychus urticae TaxID=32264 RepID=T1KC89_TETUR